MPSLAVTASQVFRYFLSGAFLVGVMRVLGFRLEDSLGVEIASPIGAVLVVLIGALSYCAHRILFNPVFHRFALLAIKGQQLFRLSGWKFLLFWWPLDAEIKVTARRHVYPSSRDYFLSWSGEIHFVYQVAEIIFVCLLCVPGQRRWWWYAIPPVVAVLNWCWHVTELRVELTARTEAVAGRSAATD